MRPKPAKLAAALNVGGLLASQISWVKYEGNTEPEMKSSGDRVTACEGIFSLSVLGPSPRSCFCLVVCVLVPEGGLFETGRH